MIITKFSSGLGNQLFQYGASSALAKRTNSNICADPASYSLQFSRRSTNQTTQREFELQRLGFPMKYRKIPTSWLAKVRGYSRLRNWMLDQRHTNYRCSGTWSRSFEQLDGNVILRGYFQDFRYMGAALDQVVAEVGNLLDCQPTRKLDGVLHVRRGDYLKYPEFYSDWFESYSKSAIEQLESAYNCQKISIFSNDLDWCQKNLSSKTAELQFVPPDSHCGGARDIAAMSHARVLAIANSTFSWWAAAIASNFGATVLVPQKWSSLNLNPSDNLYLPGWHVLCTSPP